VTLSGQDIYLDKHGTEASHQKYTQVIAEWLANQQHKPASSSTGAVPETQRLDVNSLLLAYWRFCEGYYLDTEGKPTKE